MPVAQERTTAAFACAWAAATRTAGAAASKNGPGPARSLSEAIEPRADGLVVRVRVQPRGSRDALEGRVGGRLRVRLTAPPVDNAANEACRSLFAKLLEVPRRAVELTSGHKSRDKTLHIVGDAGALAARLEALLQP